MKARQAREALGRSRASSSCRRSPPFRAAARLAVHRLRGRHQLGGGRASGTGAPRVAMFSMVAGTPLSAHGWLALQPALAMPRPAPTRPPHRARWRCRCGSQRSMCASTARSTSTRAEPARAVGVAQFGSAFRSCHSSAMRRSRFISRRSVAFRSVRPTVTDRLQLRVQHAHRCDAVDGAQIRQRGAAACPASICPAHERRARGAVAPGSGIR